MSILYLAAPYSKGDAETRLARFQAVTQVAARLIEQKIVVFSPVTMTHPIDLVLASEGETLGSDYWVTFDEMFMNICSEIAVLMLPGWQVSSGVGREIEFFKNRGSTVKFLRPEDYGISGDYPKFRAAFEYASDRG